MDIRDCVTLAEYRNTVLRLKQSEVAKLALCDQSWVSAVENGKLPHRASRTWDALVRVFSLIGREEQFVRMVQNAARLKALRKHLSEDFPLDLFARAEGSGRVVQMPDGELLRRMQPAAERLA